MKMEQQVWMTDASVSAATQECLKARWRASALALGAIVWLLAWYGDTAQSMVLTWHHSQTFVHGYFVVPISIWLIWRRVPELATLPVHPNAFIIPLVALVGFGWLVARAAGVVVVQQYALVLTIGLLVWAILGNKIAWSLAFPLSFLLFAVPFGEFLLSPLMELTADFTVFALRASDIPVYREGLSFVTPTGNWSVVEACSGLRYLIACATVGVLYAHLRYRSSVRRVVFVMACLIMPIVANWFRAYTIVIIDHWLGKQYAVQIDHLIYGWVFFAALTLLLFWIGSFWREDWDRRPVAPLIRPVPLNSDSMKAMVVTTLAAGVLITIWPVAASWFDRPEDSASVVLKAPPATGGWEPITERVTNWVPHYINPAAQIERNYVRKGDGKRVGLFIAYYNNQRPGVQLITSVNTLVSSEDREWRKTGEARRTIVANGKTFSSIEAQLQGGPQRLMVWQWYWVDGQYTVNSYWAKLLQARSRMAGRGGDGAVIIVYTGVDSDAEGTARLLREFVNVMLPVVARNLPQRG